MEIERDRMRSRLKIIVYVGLAISIALITQTLVVEHEQLSWLYFAFPILIGTSALVKNAKTKKWTAVLSMAVIVLGGILEPLELDAVEETFILLPLCYVVIFPGSLWPMFVAVLIVVSYLYELPAEEFDEFIEDAIELVAITVFATVMTYFQQKSDRQAQEYRKDSLTDYLTQLPNRKEMMLDVDFYLKEDVHGLGVIQIGVNDFKNVNDSLGYSNGDLVLVALSKRLASIVGTKGKLYRLGGDEFIVLVKSDLNVEQKIRSLLEDLSKQYSPRYKVDNTSYSISFSCGVALLSDADNNVSLWGKNADIALYKARMKGAGKVQWYDDELLDETIRQHQIETELKRAIEKQQFMLVYQPKVCVDTQKIVGAEALIRWPHPNLGMIAPYEFIDIAEKTAQIIPIGQWVIRDACIQAKKWFDMGHPICVSVNVSTVQFAHDDILQCTGSALIETGLPAHLLQIEITETTLMRQRDKVVSTCEKLRELGVTIAVDDFGVAYSSLNYLKKLPIDVLKIDKSFIDDCVTEKTDQMLVRTIIQMGQNLDKKVIAEGVETDEQLALIGREGCHEYQGYLFAKPLSVTEFTLLLQDSSQQTT
ncbi:putative bifunctional diguanylate cyclase/phosphodiesterase [Vibrio sonorensis]|uniref:putative bifunctional diguanylate cyclase/phosphodiesterase n=1 Tax=Vibrio sonorensis TaxID=1004316 RepID=UPI0008D9C808|nr:GGDEF domain-containing phosphodiesterase [Vibrio sonorensis]